MTKSKKLCIIDGYNVIYQSPALKKSLRISLEKARMHLVDLAAHYVDATGKPCLIVFDGRGSCSKSYVRLPRGVDVVFSKSGATADMVIEKTVRNRSCASLVEVVSADRHVIDLIRGYGGRALSVSEFLLMVDQYVIEMRKDLQIRKLTNDIKMN